MIVSALAHRSSTLNRRSALAWPRDDRYDAAGAMVMVDAFAILRRHQLILRSARVVLQRAALARWRPSGLGPELTQHYEVAAEPSSTLSTVNITTDPAGARVLVDGEPRGTSPLSVTGLSAASHKVTVVGEGGTVERQIVTEAGVTSSLVVSLPRTGAVSAGWLAVSEPFEVQAVERGDVIGTSASPRVMVPAGTHEMDLVNETLGYSEHRRIEVKPGGTATIVTCAGTLSINARPWAEVTSTANPSDRRRSPT